MRASKGRSRCSARIGPLVLATAVSLTAGPAVAGTTALANLELEELMDLEVTVATRRPTRVSEAPSTVSVVTAGQIRDHGWLSLNDVLASLPGFARSQDYERRTTSARGLFEGWNSNHTLLLIDGLPLNDADFQMAPTWELTSLDFVKQVEVVRGPSSALYGSNALNGAIGLETVRAADLPGGLRARVRLGAGTSQLSLVGGQAGQRGELVAGFARFSSLGDPRREVDASLRTDPDGALARFRTHDHRSYHHAMLVARPAGALAGLTLRLDAQDSLTGSNFGWLYQVPDQPDVIVDRHLTGSARYQHQVGRFALDHAVQWQRRRSEYALHLVPPGGYDGYYPDGVEEVLDYGAHGLWARSQATLALPDDASALGGVEYRALLLGEARHQLDADPVSFVPLGQLREVGGFYQSVHDHPIHQLAAYGQLDSGGWLGRLRVFAAARYDGLVARYHIAEGPIRSRDFHQLSPRIGLVVRAHEGLTAKLMAGRAFRMPSAEELFAQNSWIVAANPETLEPETDVTYEAALDALPHPALRLRGNGFLAQRVGQVGYTIDDQQRLGNLYTNRRIGLETEALFEHRGGGVELAGYASYTFVRLLDEDAVDPSVTAGDRLADVPAQLGKLGGRLSGPRWAVALAAYAQGRTFRRASSRRTPEFRSYRPTSVPGHVTLDLSSAIEPVAGLRLGLQINNLFDDRARLAAVANAPFDYRVEPRRILVTLELEP